MKKRWMTAILTTLLFTLLCGCSSPDTAPDNQSETSSVSIQNGTISIYPSLACLYMDELSPYMNVEFDCKIIEKDSYGEALQTLLEGKSDVCAAPLSAVLKAQTQGEPVKILCNLFQKGTAVVGSPQIDTLQDLAGKTVAYTPDTMEYTLLYLKLKEEGMDPSKIEWREMEPKEMNQALSLGEIDAYCADPVTSGQAVASGIGKVIAYPYQEILGYNNIVLVSIQSAIEANREWIQEVVNANRQVVKMAAQNQDFLREKAQAKGWKADEILLEADNFEWVWDMEEEYVIYTRNLASQMTQAGLLKKMPNMDTLFDFTFLEKNNQEYLS